LAFVSALASIPATIAAVVLYMVVVFHERPALYLLPDALFFGYMPAFYGAVVAAITGALLGVLRAKMNRVQFVLLAIGIAMILGCVLGFWLVGDSPHISRKIVAGLLAVTWSTMAAAVTLISERKRYERK
jgi:hypothetical protein